MSEKKPSKVFGRVILSLLGIGTFFLFRGVLKWNLFLSLLMGLGALLVFRAIFKALKRKFNPDVEDWQAITDELVKETLKEGRQKVMKLRYVARNINDMDVRQKVEKIGDVVEATFESFKKDPKDIKTARPFLNYHLDSAITVINRYTELSRSDADSPKKKETLEKAETLLSTIENAFSRHLEKLAENDVMDLDIEIEVLRKTLKADGLSEE